MASDGASTFWGILTKFAAYDENRAVAWARPLGHWLMDVIGECEAREALIASCRATAAVATTQH